jgi:penicillin-binding protein-related factor A (putative recombinase)
VNSLETDLDFANDWYRRKRIAVVEHLHPKVKGAPGHMWPIESAAYDYLGMWHGRVIAFEAKEARDTKHFPESIPQMQGRPRLWSKHLRQMAALVEARDIGRAIAFVLVRDPTIGGCWLLHHEDLDVLASGNKVLLRDVATVGTPRERAWRRSVNEPTRVLTHAQPYLADTPLRDHVRNLAPMLAYLDLVADAFQLPRPAVHHA